MTVGAVTLAYNDEETIGGTIRCLKSLVDDHLVLISEKPYFGIDEKPDRTKDICDELDVKVIQGTWELDHYQRTLGNNYSRHFDWVLGFDSDEMITREDGEKLLQFLSKTKSEAVAVTPKIYWKTTDFRLEPYPTYQPIIAMRPWVRFTHIRNIDTPYTVIDNITYHHLSWCEPKDILKKVLHYAHAPEFNGKEWYEKHYLNWKEGEPVVLPTGTYKAVYDPLPDELKKLL